MTPEELQKALDDAATKEAKFRKNKMDREAAAAEKEKNKGYWEKIKDMVTSTPVVKPQYGKDPLNRNLTEAEKLAMAARGGK
jgi:Skp family chaperone for outer membrane proteins